MHIAIVTVVSVLVPVIIHFFDHSGVSSALFDIFLLGIYIPKHRWRGAWRRRVFRLRGRPPPNGSLLLYNFENI